MAAVSSFDELVRTLVAEGLAEAFGPYLRRLSDPECLTYSIPQAAKVLGTSPHMVRRAIEAGHLPLVPHMGERRLIPRAAVEELIASATAAAS